LPVDLHSGWHVRLAAGPRGKGSTGRRAVGSGSRVGSDGRRQIEELGRVAAP
jgi:hypothetical protein